MRRARSAALRPLAQPSGSMTRRLGDDRIRPNISPSDSSTAEPRDASTGSIDAAGLGLRVGDDAGVDLGEPFGDPVRVGQEERGTKGSGSGCACRHARR